jgi:hypothetical protein
MNIYILGFLDPHRGLIHLGRRWDNFHHGSQVSDPETGGAGGRVESAHQVSDDEAG